MPLACVEELGSGQAPWRARRRVCLKLPKVHLLAELVKCSEIVPIVPPNRRRRDLAALPFGPRLKALGRVPFEGVVSLFFTTSSLRASRRCLSGFSVLLLLLLLLVGSVAASKVVLAVSSKSCSGSAGSSLRARRLRRLLRDEDEASPSGTKSQTP